MYEIFTDGGARGNPGPAGIGVYVLRNGKPVHEIKEYLGVATNNVAEYMALVRALEWVSEQSDAEVVVMKLDSELVVKQMRGEYKVKNPALKELWSAAQKLAYTLNAVSYEHVRREQNVEADRLANEAMDSASNAH